MRPAPRARPPRQRSGSGPLAFVLVVIVLVIVAATQAQGALGSTVMDLVAQRPTLLRQAPIRALVSARIGGEVDVAADPSGAARTFEIERGDTAGAVAQRLEDQGIVRDRLALLLVLYDEGHEDDLQAGIHTVSAAMTTRQVAQAIAATATAQQTTLRIIEGWRLSEITDAVTKAFPKITQDAFLKAAVVGTHPQRSLAGLDPKLPLEGFLYPDTYFFKPDATADTIVNTLLDTFESKAGATLRGATGDQKRSVYDLVKLASIVEREARDRTESPRIAGVYANRLRIGMKLDADPTIQYAVGQWRVLTLDDLKIDSPYNTYVVAGLPPTPICSPGVDALNAAAKPEQNDYFYFVAKNDASGDHLFARTLDEQEANRKKVGND
ncbi:MAG: endolytic transglycosylase MltG [Chloroflexota bacterium]|nr:endolytic transglycosylase MltG [Chloroflexota bacterium]MDE3192145.1 endolytic transglycosylase MltG [Chloroflexota bacterium]